MINIDSSLFLQIVNFLVLIWVLNIVLYRPIRGVLLERKEKISGLEDGITSLDEEARDKDEAFISGIKSARAEGLKQKQSLIQAAEVEEKALISKINENAQAELVNVREKIAKDAEEVRNSLLQDVDRFATEIGKKILGRAF